MHYRLNSALNSHFECVHLVKYYPVIYQNFPGFLASHAQNEVFPTVCIQGCVYVYGYMQTRML